MTNEERIERLRKCASFETCNPEMCDLYSEDDCRSILLKDAADALEAAEKRIKELESQAAFFDAEKLNYQENIVYRDELIKELEAQLPKEGECEAKKPKTVKETGYSFYCDCPTCGVRLISNVDGEWCAGTFDRFCWMCGQKIDWSEYLDGRISRAARG